MPRGTAFDVEVGVRIRHRRKSIGLSQYALGKRIGFAQPQIARLEEGSQPATALNLLCLSNALQIEVNALLGTEPPQMLCACQTIRPLLVEVAHALDEVTGDV